jgi:hypothetical protein
VTFNEESRKLVEELRVFETFFENMVSSFKATENAPVNPNIKSYLFGILEKVPQYKTWTNQFIT